MSLHVCRHLLSPAKRVRAVARLSSILQHQPSDPNSVFPSSLEILPFSLAESLKKNSCVGQWPVCDHIHSPPYPSPPPPHPTSLSTAGISLQNDSVVLQSRFKSKAPMVTCQKIDIRGIRNLARDQVCVGVS